MAEELHLHLLELARAKSEVARGDLVAETLPRLRNSERHFGADRIEHVFEIDEHPLGGLGTEERRVLRTAERSESRLEHQIELARLGELAFIVLARILARFEWAFAGFHVIDAETR